MVFEVLTQKYKCGCGMGAAELKVPGILDKINELAEWDLVKFPRTRQHDVEVNGETVPVMLEDRKYLGDDPKLEPGHCIFLGGQVIAFDSPDRMVLVISETGGRSLKRIYEEWIEAEWELTNEIENTIGFDYEDIEEVDESEYDGTMPIPYSYYRVWKNLYLNGEEKKIAVKLDGGFFPTHIVLDKWDIKYKTDEWEEGELDVLEYLVLGVLSWFCKFCPRDNSFIDHDEEDKKIIDNEIKCYLESLSEESESC